MDDIWWCEIIQKALDKGLPVRLFDAKEDGMGLQIATTKFVGFGWEAFEDVVYAEDLPEVRKLCIDYKLDIIKELKE